MRQFVTGKCLKMSNPPSLCHYGCSIELLYWQYVGGNGSTAGDMSMTVLGEVIAAHKLSTANTAHVAFLSSVTSAVTRQLIGASKRLLAVGPCTSERFFTFSINTTHSCY